MEKVKWQAVVSKPAGAGKARMFRQVKGDRNDVLDAVGKFIQQGFEVFAGPSIRRAGVRVTDLKAREALKL